MHRQIKESDWKIFRKLRPVMLERLCERILNEVEPILADPSATHQERYLALYRHLEKRDETVARLFNDFRRSTAELQLAMMHAERLLTAAELAEFSEETRSYIEHVVEVIGK